MQDTPVYSTFGADPELAELVELFVDEMPDRLRLLRDSAEGSDWPAVARLAHQIKGSAGSYGFDPLTAAAGRLEAAIRGERTETEIQAAVANLLALAQRIRSGSARLN